MKNILNQTNKNEHSVTIPSVFGEKDKISLCELKYEIESEGCWLTIKIDCDARDADCKDCPARAGL